MTKKKLLLVADARAHTVGTHFRNAAQALDLEVRFLDIQKAYQGQYLVKKWYWLAHGKRPVHLDSFSAEVIDSAKYFQPDIVLTTGISPVNAGCLRTLKQQKIACVNYLTDDPWSSSHFSPWFMKSLELYSHVFSPRQANIPQLKSLGLSVSYLPFAYAPEIHFPESAKAEEKQKYTCDVLFIGGADKDRLHYITPLIEAGFSVALWGSYWDRYAITKPYHQGYADPATIRKAVGEAKVCLGIGRHANRDGHAMRSFEVPAMRGCFLVEKTAEHQSIFGEDKQNVLYFASIEEMVKHTQWLLAHPEERERLAARCYEYITQHPHRYADRLQSILNLAA